MKRPLLALLLSLLTCSGLAAELKALPAKPAPALNLPLLRGQRIDLPALKGRVVLVNFWATWCPPCREEMPSMERLHKDLANEPFSILAVNAGEAPGAIKAFLRQVAVTFPIALDEDGQQIQAWQAFVFPTSYLVDKGGHIRYGLYGSIDWDTPGPKAIIEALVREPAEGTPAVPVPETEKPGHPQGLR
jgi:thiol-disulfide isomerase/thioredoxin